MNQIKLKKNIWKTLPVNFMNTFYVGNNVNNQFCVKSSKQIE